ncbi:hypothetical protein CJU90_1055 [Yarrowia sp. C11]|nr:hypothetical protein CKK34_2468 [Yarrowia sp. E02]KAG5373361.1 hypothetical protein CJU90_1055 [Yarrowia sp. C11]
MGKKNRFKKATRDHVGRKMEQSPTLVLDEEAQQERFARNQWYRYFSQMESHNLMTKQAEAGSIATQTMLHVGQPLGISVDSELGQVLQADFRAVLQAQREAAKGDIKEPEKSPKSPKKEKSPRIPNGPKSPTRSWRTRKT